MKTKSFADIPSFGDLSFGQFAFNYCADSARLIEARLNRELTIAAFAACYNIYVRFHAYPTDTERRRTPIGRFVARTIDEAHPERKFAQFAFSFMSQRMLDIRRRDPSAKRLTATQWRTYIQDAFDIFRHNPHARSLAADEARSHRSHRDPAYAEVDEVLEAAAQRNSLNEWADRRTNFGKGRL